MKIKQQRNMTHWKKDGLGKLPDHLHCLILTYPEFKCQQDSRIVLLVPMFKILPYYL